MEARIADQRIGSLLMDQIPFVPLRLNDLVYVICKIWRLRTILLAAFKRFCAMAAIANWAWVLAVPKYRALAKLNRRFIVPKHCSTQKRRFEISLLKHFSEALSGRPLTAFRMIPSRCLPFKKARFELSRVYRRVICSNVRRLDHSHVFLLSMSPLFG